MPKTGDFLYKWNEQPASYTQRDVALYALSVGSGRLEHTYELAPHFAVLPTYATVLPFKGTATGALPFPSPAMQATAPWPKMKTKFLLDGERELHVLRPLPAADTQLRMRDRLVAVVPKGKGVSVETETLFCGQDGTVYTRLLTSTYCVGAKAEAAGQTVFSKVKVPSCEPDAVREVRTTPLQASLYRLNGDYNALHIDPAVAKASGFERPILHGLCTYGLMVCAVLEQFADGDASAYKASRIKFVRPVLPGQTLLVNMWRVPSGSSAERVVVTVTVKETGAVCAANSFVDLHSCDAKL